MISTINILKGNTYQNCNQPFNSSAYKRTELYFYAQPQEYILALQEKRLRKMLKHAFEHSLLINQCSGNQT